MSLMFPALALAVGSAASFAHAAVPSQAAVVRVVCISPLSAAYERSSESRTGDLPPDLLRKGVTLASVEPQPDPERSIPPQPPAADRSSLNVPDGDSADQVRSGQSARESASKRTDSTTPPAGRLQSSSTGRTVQIESGGTSGSADVERTMLELHRLDREVSRLTTQLSLARDDQKKVEISTQIEVVLVQQFELRQHCREQELKGLEERVRKLRESFSKRQNAKTEIVKHRLEEIQRDAEGLGWGESNAGEITIKGSFEHFLPSQGALPRTTLSPTTTTAPAARIVPAR